MKNKQIEPIINENMTSLDSLLPDFSEPLPGEPDLSEPLPGEQDFLEWLHTPQPELFDIYLERTPDE